MDYEKKYKEAIKKAKSKIKNDKDHVLYEDDIIDIFPELKESDDERIRNEIIAFVEQSIHRGGGTPIPQEQEDKWIAWLEKQVSQDNTEDVDILHRFSFYSYKDEPNVLYLSGLYVNEEYRNKGIGTKILEVADEVVKSLNCRAIRLKTKKDSDAERLYRIHGYNSLTAEDKDEIWLEKQGENISLPKFTFDDVLALQCAIEAAKKVQKDKDLYEQLESLHGRLHDAYWLEKQGEQKPADLKTKAGNWYICDMEVINENMETAFHRNEIYYCPKDGYLDVGGALFEVGRLDVFRLAVEKEIPQPRQEWSEEDENRFNNLIFLVEHSDENKATKEGFIKFINKLKSLKYRYTWKPSDRQMKAIEHICDGNYNVDLDILDSIYKDFKKLREE